MASDRFGIAAIGAYLPEQTQDNLSLARKFGFANDFLETKIGVVAPRLKAAGQETSDLCVEAFSDLQAARSIDPATIDLAVVVTQNPDGHGLPHTSAIVHRKLKLPKSCFAFDVSLGCSGYVAALAIVTGFLDATGGRRALLFTADPYSKVIDPDDRNTRLLFGDAASATLIDADGDWRLGAFDLGTDGQKSHALEVRNGRLAMDGRIVFDFCMLNVPASIVRTLEGNGVTKDEVSRFVLHTGSKFIVDSLRQRLGVSPAAFPAPYGNTVSSSIPMQLKELDPGTNPVVVISGFGVGLGWATTLLRAF